MKKLELHMMTGIILFLLMCSMPLESTADVTYTYTGSNFMINRIRNSNPNNDQFSTANFITFSFSVPDYLPANLSIPSYFTQTVYPTAWSMTDGMHTNSSSNGGSLQTLAIATDSNADVMYWDAFTIQTYTPDPLYTVNMRAYLYPNGMIQTYNNWATQATDVAAIRPVDGLYSLHPINSGEYFNATSGSWAVTGTPDSPVAPEPISSILFITGGTLLAGRRYLRMNERGHR